MVLCPAALAAVDGASSVRNGNKGRKRKKKEDSSRYGEALLASVVGLKAVEDSTINAKKVKKVFFLTFSIHIFSTFCVCFVYFLSFKFTHDLSHLFFFFSSVKNYLFDGPSPQRCLFCCFACATGDPDF